MIEKPEVVESTYEREILAALRRMAWRNADRWVSIDIGDPWEFASRMPVPTEIGFAALPRVEFVLDRLRVLADTGAIQPAWREVDGRPRFGYVVPPRQKRKARSKVVWGLTESDRHFLADLLIRWDAPAGP